MINRLGINFWNWIDSFSDKELYLFEKAKRFGFDSCEIGMVSTDFDYAAVRKITGELQMELTLCGAFIKGRDISSFDEQIRQNTKQYFCDCFEAAEKTGAKIFGGPVYAGGGKTHLLSPDDQKREWDYAVKGLAEMSRVAKNHGVTIALEPINRYRTSVVNTVEQALKMVSDIGSPNVGILFDTYQAGIEEDDILDALGRVCKAGKLVHFHACGSNRAAPGRGHLPWLELVKILKQYNYGGNITIESFPAGGMDGAWRQLDESPDQLAEKGIHYLKNLLTM